MVMTRNDYVIMVVRIGLLALFLLATGCGPYASAAQPQQAAHAPSSAAPSAPSAVAEEGHWSRCVRIWARNPLTGKHYLVCAYWWLGDPALMASSQQLQAPSRQDAEAAKEKR